MASNRWALFVLILFRFLNATCYEMTIFRNAAGMLAFVNTVISFVGALIA